MLNELAVTLRRLGHAPAFTLAAVATLTLGIAAPTTLFSAINAVLLRPLPYPAPGDLYTVRTTMTDGRYTSGLVAAEELAELQRRSGDVLHATGALPADLTLLTAGGAVGVSGYAVWRNFFDLFALPMTLGRGFTEEDHGQSASPGVVLSHALWRSHYGADPAIVGSSILIPDARLLVVGVAHPSLDAPAGAQLWLNLRRPAQNIGHDLYGYVRLRPGVSPDALSGPMTASMQMLAEKYPDMNRNRIFVLSPMLQSVVGDLRQVLIVVFGTTALLLALTCLNVTQLLLARATGRMREAAIHAALGASRWRIVRLSLLEAWVIALAGGALGVLAAQAGLRALLAAGASGLPRLERATFDAPVWLFALGLTFLVATVVGVVPAVRASGADPAALMNEGGRGGSSGAWTRGALAALVVIEIAVGVALVASTGLMVRSYSGLRAADAGFSFDNRLVVDVRFPGRYADPVRQQQLVESLAEGLNARGADAVAAASSLPLRPELDTTTFVDFVGHPVPEPHNRPNARLRMISPDFFSVLGAQLVAGRDFTSADTAKSPGVAVVNEAFVRRFWPTRDPLKERLWLPGFRMHRNPDGTFTQETVEVVGVVRDMQYAGLHVPAEQTLYMPLAQRPRPRASLIVAAPPERLESLRGALPRVIAEADAEISFETTSLIQVLDASLSRQRLGTMLMVLFGATALALLAVGVFGVVAYGVGQRTREIAIRLALGAPRATIFRTVVGQIVRIGAVGLAFGLLLSWWTGSIVAAYLHGVRVLEPAVWALSALGVLAVALAATLIPARRACAVDPASMLRSG